MREQIVALAIRVFAVFLLVYGLRSLSTFVPIGYINDMASEAWIWIAVFAIVLFGIVWLLWFFPLSIARKLLPRTTQKSTEVAVSAQEIETIAFTVLGLWVLSTGVPDIIYWITYWLTIANASVDPDISLDRLGYTLATVMEIIIGVWLMFGAKGLRGLLHRMRYAGSN